MSAAAGRARQPRPRAARRGRGEASLSAPGPAPAGPHSPVEGDGAAQRLALPVGAVGGGAADHHLRPRPGPPQPPRRPGPARPPAVQQDGGARSPRRPSALGKGFLYGAAVSRHGGRRVAAAILAEGPPRGAAAEGGRLPAPLACLFLAAGRPPPDERLGPPPACPRRSGAAFPGVEGRGPAASVQHDGRARPPEFLGAYSRRAAPMGGATGPLARRRRRRSASRGPAFPPPTRRLSALRRSVPYDDMAAPRACCGAPELEKTANRRAGRRRDALPLGERGAGDGGSGLGCAGAYVSAGSAAGAALGGAAAMDAGGCRAAAPSRASARPAAVRRSRLPREEGRALREEGLALRGPRLCQLRP